MGLTLQLDGGDALSAALNEINTLAGETDKTLQALAGQFNRLDDQVATSATIFLGFARSAKELSDTLARVGSFTRFQKLLETVRESAGLNVSELITGLTGLVSVVERLDNTNVSDSAKGLGAFLRAVGRGTAQLAGTDFDASGIKQLPEFVRSVATAGRLLAKTSQDLNATSVTGIVNVLRQLGVIVQRAKELLPSSRFLGFTQEGQLQQLSDFFRRLSLVTNQISTIRDTSTFEPVLKLVQGLGTVIRAVQRSIPTNVPFLRNNALQAFPVFIRDLVEIARVASGLTIQRVNLESIVQFVEDIGKIARAVQRNIRTNRLRILNANPLNVFVSFINSLNRAVKATNDIQAVRINLETVIDFVRDIGRIVNSVQRNIDARRLRILQRSPLDSFIKFMRDIQRTAAAAAQIGTSSFNLPVIIQFVQDIGRIVRSAQRNINAQRFRFLERDPLRVLVQFIRNLNRVIQASSDLNINAPNLGVIVQFMNDIGDIVRAANRNVPVNRLRILNASPLNVLLDFIRDINEIVRVSSAVPTSSNLTAIVTFVREIGRIITSIQQNLDTSRLRVLQRDPLKVFREFIVELSNSIRALTDVSDMGLGADLDAVSRLRTSTATLIRSLSDIIDLFTGPLATQLRASTRLGRIADALGRTSPILRLAQRFRPFAEELGAAFRGITNIPDDATRRLNAIARLLEQLPVFIRRLSDVQQDIPRRGLFDRRSPLIRVVDGLGPFTKLLTDALQNLASVQRVGSTEFVSRVLRELNDFIQTAERIARDVQSGQFARIIESFQGLPRFARFLARAFNRFRRIRLDPTALNGISRALIGISLIFRELRQVNTAGAEASAQAIGRVLQSIFEGLQQGIRGSGLDFRSLGVEGADEFIEGFEDRAGIASPSTVFARIGRNLVQGLERGFDIALLTRVATEGATAFVRAFSRIMIQGVRDVATTLQREFRQIGQNLRGSGQTLIQSGVTALATGGLVGFLTAGPIEAAGSFQVLLDQIQVFGGLTDQELGQARAAIEDFSAATVFGANESAEAFLNLQRAGLSAQESIIALPSIGALASAGQIEIAQASELALQALNSFGLGINEIERVVNTFAAGANSSIASVDGIGQALGFVGPVAASLGITIEETAASIALLNDQGIRGERAGTGLRAILQSLAAPTERAQKALAGLGVEVRDANGNFVGLEALIEDFSESIGDLRDAGEGDVQIIERLSALGDRNAITALLALITETEDATGEATIAFRQYLESLDDAATAQELADAQTDNFRGRLISLAGSLSVLRNRALNPLLEDVLKPILEVLIEVVNAVASLPAPILAAAAAVPLLIATFSTLSGVILIVTGAIAFSLFPAFVALSGILTVFTNPAGVLITLGSLLTGLVTIFAALTAAVIALSPVFGIFALLIADAQRNTEQIGESLESLGEAFSGLFDTVSGLGTAIGGFISAFAPAAEAAESVGDSAQEAFSPLAALIDFVTASVNRLSQRLDQLTSFLNAAAAIQTDGLFAEFEIPLPDVALPSNLVEQRNALEAEISALNDAISGDGAEAFGAYEVVAGDTLSAIAAEYGVTVRELVEANEQITDPNRIFVGQELTIPGALAADSEEAKRELSELEKELNAVNAQISERNIRGTFLELLLNSDNFVAQNIFDAAGIDEIEDPTERYIAQVQALGAAFDRIEEAVSRIGQSFRRLNVGIRALVQGDTQRGIQQLTLGFTRLGLSILEIFSVIFGFEIGDTLFEALRTGNIPQLIELGVEFIFDTVIDAAQSLAPLIGTILANSVFGSLQIGLLFLERALGVDLSDVQSLIGELSGVFGTVISSAIQNIGSVLQGEQTLGEAINNIVGDAATEVENSPQLQRIIDALNLPEIDVSNITEAFNELIDAVEEIPSDSGTQAFVDSIGGFIAIFTGQGGEGGDFNFVQLGADTIAFAIRAIASAVRLISGPGLLIASFFIDTLSAALAGLGSELDEYPNIAPKITGIATALAALSAVGGLGKIALAVARLGRALGVFALVIVGLRIAGNLVDPVVDVIESVAGAITSLAEGDLSGLGSELQNIAIGFGDIGKAIVEGFVEGSVDLAQLAFDVFALFGLTDEDGNPLDVRDRVAPITDALAVIFELIGLAFELGFIELAAQFLSGFNRFAQLIAPAADAIDDIAAEVGLDTNIGGALTDGFGDLSQEQATAAADLRQALAGLNEQRDVLSELVDIAVFDDIDFSDFNLTEFIEAAEDLNPDQIDALQNELVEIINLANDFDAPEGEITALQRLLEAVDAIERGEPVDVETLFTGVDNFERDVERAEFAASGLSEIFEELPTDETFEVNPEIDVSPILGAIDALEQQDIDTFRREIGEQISETEAAPVRVALQGVDLALAGQDEDLSQEFRDLINDAFTIGDDGSVIVDFAGVSFPLDFENVDDALDIAGFDPDEIVRLFNLALTADASSPEVAREAGGQLVSNFIDSAFEQGIDPDLIAAQLRALGFDNSVIIEAIDASLFGDELVFDRAIPQEQIAATFNQVGNDVTDGVEAGIEEGAEDTNRAVRDFAREDIINPAQEELGTESPSTVFREIGQDVITGLGLGIRDEIPFLQQSLALALNEFEGFKGRLDIIGAEIAATVAAISLSLTNVPATVPQAGTVPSGVLPAPASGQQVSTQNVVQFGNVNVTNTTGQVTPEDVAAGLELYTEQNPPQRTTRNFI